MNTSYLIAAYQSCIDDDVFKERPLHKNCNRRQWCAEYFSDLNHLYNLSAHITVIYYLTISLEYE